MGSAGNDLEKLPLLDVKYESRAETKANSRRAVMGIALMCTASVSFAAMATTVRWGSTTLSSPYLAFTRALMQGLFALVYCAKFRINPFGPKEARAVLALRGITGFMGATSYYFTLRFLPIGDANALTFTGPIITMVMASVFLGESFRSFHVFGAAAASIGVILVAGPNEIIKNLRTSEGGTTRLIGTCCALSQAVCSSMSYLAIRSVGDKASFACSVFAFSLYVAPLMAVEGYILGTPVFMLPRSGREWVVVLLAGSFALLANSLLSLSLQMVEASKSGPARNLQLLFAFLFGWLFLGETPKIESIIGSCIILSAILYIGYKTLEEERSEYPDAPSPFPPETPTPDM
uniref:EamA domain-containing protein n=2 Tax=Rhodosorus marinus TaxID=101924 RepID=A0A7S3EDR8_9RHOD|mmetsp:Transcript_28224/g.110856  ORF Transcript_28224/g.110856 Transcript_28224/m.110856 type:complete len:348 (+) Transcript_28224:255-1298(+)